MCGFVLVFLRMPPLTAPTTLAVKLCLEKSKGTKIYRNKRLDTPDIYSLSLKNKNRGAIIRVTKISKGRNINYRKRPTLKHVQHRKLEEFSENETTAF